MLGEADLIRSRSFLFPHLEPRRRNGLLFGFLLRSFLSVLSSDNERRIPYPHQKLQHELHIIPCFSSHNPTPHTSVPTRTLPRDLLPRRPTDPLNPLLFLSRLPRARYALPLRDRSSQRPPQTVYPPNASNRRTPPFPRRSLRPNPSHHSLRQWASSTYGRHPDARPPLHPSLLPCLLPLHALQQLCRLPFQSRPSPPREKLLPTINEATQTEFEWAAILASHPLDDGSSEPDLIRLSDSTLFASSKSSSASR
jgi:hypothetical protein